MLDIGRNNFHGNSFFPVFYYNLVCWFMNIYIYICLINFAGIIPAEIGELSNLKEYLITFALVFQVSWNFFSTWTICMDRSLYISVCVHYLEFCRWRRIDSPVLYLGRSETWPPFKIFLRYNYLTGTINFFFFFLSICWILLNPRSWIWNFINYNFAGSIPQELGNLHRLEDFYLGFNHLIEGLPNSLGDLKYLEHLRLFENSLTRGNLQLQIWASSAIYQTADL